MAKSKSTKKKYTPRLGDIVFVRDANGKVNRKENFIYLRQLSIPELMVLTKVPVSKSTYEMMIGILGKTHMDEFDSLVAYFDPTKNLIEMNYVSSASIEPDVITSVQLQKLKGYMPFVKSVMRNLNKDIKKIIKEMPEKLPEDESRTSK